MIRKPWSACLLPALLLACLALFALPPAGAAAAFRAASRRAEVDPQVCALLAASADGEAACILLLADRADLAPAARVSGGVRPTHAVYARLRGAGE